MAASLPGHVRLSPSCASLCIALAIFAPMEQHEYIDNPVLLHVKRLADEGRPLSSYLFPFVREGVRYTLDAGKELDASFDAYAGGWRVSCPFLLLYGRADCPEGAVAAFRDALHERLSHARRMASRGFSEEFGATLSRIGSLVSATSLQSPPDDGLPFLYSF